MKWPSFARRQKNSAGSPSPPTVVGVTSQLPDSWAWNPFQFLTRKWEKNRSIDVTTFQYYTLNDLLDMLSVVHPEVSLALWQFLRVAATGIQLKAKNLDGTESKRGQKAIDDLVWKMNHPSSSSGRFEPSRGIDKICLQLLLNAMLRGGIGMELVLNAKGRCDHLAPFDTGTLHYRTDPDTKRLIPYQYQSLKDNMGYVSIDYPTIFIEALDEAIDDPYGRNPLASAVSIVVFQLQFLADLKAAVHQVGYPRLHAKIIEEILVKNAPDVVKNDPKKFADWANTIKATIQAQLKDLKPDDVLVSFDSLELGLVGSGGGGQSIRIEPIVTAIERSLAASLKTLQTVLGRPDMSVGGERYAAELKLYSRGVQSVQAIAERILERALTMALNLEGIRGWVDVSFLPVDLRSDLQVVAEKQNKQDVVIAARQRAAISDFEEMQLHREILGLIGEPDKWEELLKERKDREAQGPVEIPRHGSPPSTQ